MTENDLQRNREMVSNFLINVNIPEPMRCNGDKPYGYIYCIENMDSGRKYIGSTYAVYVGVANPNPRHSLHKRASQYIYAYNKAIECKTSSNSKTFRPIINALAEYGIDRFRMYPIAETDKENHLERESYFINYYDTINTGYNVVKASLNVNRKLRSTTLSNEAKKLRSQPVVCVNMNQKQLVFADSMKLFADYLGTSKTMIKNATRKGMPYKGWFVFYTDKQKREYILINNVLNDQDKRIQDRHSDKAKQFYQGLYNSIGDLINDPNNNNEYFPGFTRLESLEYKV